MLARDLPAEEGRTIYIQCEKASRTEKGDGTTFYGCKAKYLQEGVGWVDVDIAQGRLTLYDSQMKKATPTNPLALTPRWSQAKTRFYWYCDDITGKPALKVGEFEKKFYGPGGGMAKPQRTTEEIDALHIAAAAKVMEMLEDIGIEWRSDLQGFSALVAQRFIAYNEQSPKSNEQKLNEAVGNAAPSFDPPKGPEQAGGVSDDDIPF